MTYLKYTSKNTSKEPTYWIVKSDGFYEYTADPRPSFVDWDAFVSEVNLNTYHQHNIEILTEEELFTDML